MAEIVRTLVVRLDHDGRIELVPDELQHGLRADQLDGAGGQRDQLRLGGRHRDAMLPPGARANVAAPSA